MLKSLSKIWQPKSPSKQNMMQRARDYGEYGQTIDTMYMKENLPYFHSPSSNAYTSWEDTQRIAAEQKSIIAPLGYEVVDQEDSLAAVYKVAFQANYINQLLTPYGYCVLLSNYLKSQSNLEYVENSLESLSEGLYVIIRGDKETVRGKINSSHLTSDDTYLFFALGGPEAAGTKWSVLSNIPPAEYAAPEYLSHFSTIDLSTRLRWFDKKSCWTSGNIPLIGHDGLELFCIIWTPLNALRSQSPDGEKEE
ncbi:hypothetical protein PN437_04065 [Microcystis aeruginosa CS-564/01]|uniref:hypothetical protein n=1 Tax=Microcystis aeruginosa TaxID=1126 RepID=UPI00232DF7C5|nr:hypothetical protein [Microcystis aeruginosa]MDB9424103.1 hypothetical protein [Microcystis aeruginosa CS-564/01]